MGVAPDSACLERLLSDLPPGALGAPATEVEAQGGSAPGSLSCCTTAIVPFRSNEMERHASAFPASKAKWGSNLSEENNFKIQSKEAHASTLGMEFSRGLPVFIVHHERCISDRKGLSLECLTVSCVTLRCG